MGQSIGRVASSMVCKEEYDSLLDRSKRMERLNKELKKTVLNLESSGDTLRSAFSQVKDQLDSTQSGFISIEKQLREAQNRHELMRPTMDKLRTELAEAQGKQVAAVEDLSKLKKQNILLEDQAGVMRVKLTSLQRETAAKAKEDADLIESLKAKNSGLREQLQTQQEELAVLKKSISMINNIVDNT